MYKRQTLCAGADVLLKYGAKKIIACASHGVLSGPAIDRINATEALDRVIVTDTIPLGDKLAQCPKPVSYTHLDVYKRQLLDSLGKRDEAMKVMQGIIASHPEHYQALNYVGYSLAVQGKDLEHALELLQRADRLAPDQFFIVDSLAWALFRLGRTEEALQNIRRAVALVPSPEAEILEHYGDIAAAAGQKEEARKAYEQALKLKPANAESLRQRLGDL